MFVGAASSSSSLASRLLARGVCRTVVRPAGPLAHARCITSAASAVWRGTLKSGQGSMSTASLALDNAPFSYMSRFDKGGEVNDSGHKAPTNPEELIAASIAGCYSMFLSALLSKESLNPESISTNCEIVLGDGPQITEISLTCEAKVAGINNDKFQELANTAKNACPVSMALAGVETIQLQAKLL